ncbi:hypothetical protein BDV96DRAFT_4969 [Lophiotrema nucula]|uniref:Uncharacterized protein n=1 Tax=Lophiotrema nucula TaxID=690887 RepID=A0A6A5ZWQ6_9PLEO|nr:hypothetical protein BDV96DRAFT_4969 [Lophiotrema nucula]
MAMPRTCLLVQYELVGNAPSICLTASSVAAEPLVGRWSEITRDTTMPKEVRDAIFGRTASTQCVTLKCATTKSFHRNSSTCLQAHVKLRITKVLRIWSKMEYKGIGNGVDVWDPTAGLSFQGGPKTLNRDLDEKAADNLILHLFKRTFVQDMGIRSALLDVLSVTLPMSAQPIHPATLSSLDVMANKYMAILPAGKAVTILDLQPGGACLESQGRPSSRRSVQNFYTIVRILSGPFTRTITGNHRAKSIRSLVASHNILTSAEGSLQAAGGDQNPPKPPHCPPAGPPLQPPPSQGRDMMYSTRSMLVNT